MFAMCAGHCYSLIGEVTMMTGASSYQDAWAKTISPNSAWMPGFAVMSQTLVACVCYSIIIGDLGYDLLKGLGIEGWFAVRNNLLAFVSVALLLPLCLLRDFAMLSYTSMLGVAGVMYTACFMVFRKLQGSYGRGGDFYSSIPANSIPKFGSRFEAIKVRSKVKLRYDQARE
jgi:sodium-coupled neutral amino acid transporter 11